MELYQHSVYTLQQCKHVLSGLSQKDYAYRSHLIPNSSISKHVRHTLERFGVFIHSLSSQTSVNFDIATKDRRIESDLAYSKKIVDNFIDFFQRRDHIESANKGCTLTVYTPHAVSMPSTYARELHFVNAHAIHHYALMRVIATSELGLSIDKGFGAAPKRQSKL